MNRGRACRQGTQARVPAAAAYLGENQGKPGAHAVTQDLAASQAPDGVTIQGSAAWFVLSWQVLLSSSQVGPCAWRRHGRLSPEQSVRMEVGGELTAGEERLALTSLEKAGALRAISSLLLCVGFPRSPAASATLIMQMKR